MSNLACQDFTTVTEILARDDCTYDGDDHDLILAAIGAASDILYVLSGGRVTGWCEKTFRPLRRVCAPEDDPWYGLFGVTVIPLPENLISVQQLKIDGVVQAPSTYGLIDNRYLFMREGSFPVSNDLRLDDTETGTWSLTIEFGYMPDWLAIAATQEITLQLLAENSRNPGYLRGVTSASVQGASVNLDPIAADMADKGMPQLQRFLSVHAPHGGLPVGVWTPELENGWVLVEVEGPSGS